MAEDVYQLAAVLKLEHAYVVGHDIGGMVAYAYARRHPAATRGATRAQRLPGLVERASEKFVVLEEQLSSRPYLVGEDFTVADIMMTTVLREIRKTGCSLLFWHSRITLIAVSHGSWQPTH